METKFKNFGLKSDSKHDLHLIVDVGTRVCSCWYDAFDIETNQLPEGKVYMVILVEFPKPDSVEALNPTV